MDCRKYRDALSDAAAGALEAGQQRALDEHLSGCAACAARLERLKRAILAVDRALTESTEAEPSDKFLASAGARCSVPLPGIRERSWWHVSARTLAAVAAILAMVAGAWFFHAQFIGAGISSGHVTPPGTRPEEVGRAARLDAPQSSAARSQPRVASARTEPSLTAATSVRRRILRRGTVATNRPFFEKVKVAPGERAAIFQLVALLQSGKVKPQSIFPPAQDLDKPLKIAPLRIEPISIPRIEISRISEASHDPWPDPARSTVPRTDTNKETTP